MKKLKDKINFLTWEQFEPQQAENYHQQNATLDKWGKRVASNSFINKKHFITNLYTDFYGDESNFFYCYENNGDSIKDMVGAVIITPPTHKGNNASIDYIVVNPNKQNNGIGTRMIKSITNNPEFFAGRSHIGSFEAVVRESDIAPQMIFVKNHYTMAPKIHPENTPDSADMYLKFFAAKRTQISDKEM